MEGMVMGIYVIRYEGTEPSEPLSGVRVTIEGVEVLQDLRDAACAVLLGPIYSLNLSYPKDLKYTFEALRRLFMEPDGNKLSTKVQALKNKLLQWSLHSISSETDTTDLCSVSE
ncbi:hypothetical protein LDENG_00137900 [Lucifuga dentata]|nr:hypothetical protein LDENG_00137900 [Lucifuga dentata]